MAKRIERPAVLPNNVTQVERSLIERLIPRNNDPRTQGREQTAQIAVSIQEFGFTNPLLMNSRPRVYT